MITTPLKAPRHKPAASGALEHAALIVGLIKSGQITPQRRIGESSLATRLNIPRAAVRSALEHLETVGLVVRRPRAGTFIRDTTISEFCDVMDIRAALETLAARQATLRASSSEINALATLADAVDKLGTRSVDESRLVTPKLIELDLKFHLTLADLSGNSRLSATLEQQRLIEFSFALSSLPHNLRSPSNRPIPTHREIVEAIRSRDPAQAAQIMRQHIILTKEARLGVFSEDADL